MLGLISIEDTLCRPNTWLYEFDADVVWLGSGSVLGTRAMSDALFTADNQRLFAS